MEIRIAQASEKPCQFHRYHFPRVIRTQGHHLYPVYLQNRRYGRIKYPDLLWICGTCHDSIHAWLDWLLEEAQKPDPEPGSRIKKEAQKVFDWYMNA